MNQDIAKILVTTEQINNAVAQLGRELTAEYRDKNPLVIGVLRGAAPFMIDLVRAMDCYLEIDFIDVSSPPGRLSAPAVPGAMPASLVRRTGRSGQSARRTQ